MCASKDERSGRAARHERRGPGCSALHKIIRFLFDVAALYHTLPLHATSYQLDHLLRLGTCSYSKRMNVEPDTNTVTPQPPMTVVCSQ